MNGLVGISQLFKKSEAEIGLFASYQANAASTSSSTAKSASNRYPGTVVSVTSGR
jgi:hypothetical protein